MEVQEVNKVLGVVKVKRKERNRSLNKVRDKMVSIAEDLGQKKVRISIKANCPWCRKYSLIMYEKKAKFFCTNCKREGSLDELEGKIFDKMMKQHSRFKL